MSVCQKSLMEVLVLMMVVSISSAQDCNEGTYTCTFVFSILLRVKFCKPIEALANLSAIQSFSQFIAAKKDWIDI